jgi:Membrane protein involved in the export of O-antigen and teichoic acid
MRTILIYKLGSEYAGITSLFSSILQVLNLTELGFSSAVVYALYGPVAKNDDGKVCALLKFFKKIYNICGVVILSVGIVICPFIKHLISGSYPDNINIYVIFIFLLINTSISYLFCGYKSVIFIAHQRDDVTSKTQILANLLMYCMQFFFLLIVSNYNLFIISMLVGTLFNNILMNVYAKKMYPSIICKGTISEKERKQLYSNVGALFGHQLDMVIITSADNIVISAFIGLQVLTIYNNYYYIVSAVLNMLIMIANSFVASIGNSIVVDNREKNYRDFISFTYSLGMINVIASLLMIVLYQDFMKIWMGTEMSFQFSTVLLLVISFYIRQFRRSVLTYKNAAGVWNLDRYKPYVAATVNLGLNIFLVNIIGINGVIISTIASMVFIEIPWETVALFKVYLKKDMLEYLRVQMILILKMILCGIVSYLILIHIPANSIIFFIIKAILSFVIVTFLILLLSIKDSEFVKLKQVILRVILSRFAK